MVTAIPIVKSNDKDILFNYYPIFPTSVFLQYLSNPTIEKHLKFFHLHITDLLP